MKQIKWLLALANSKPLIFSIAILLIAVGSLSTVVINRDRKIDDCNFERAKMQNYYEAKYDSLTSYYRTRENQLQAEVRENLNSIIENYQNQLNEQKQVNSAVDKTLSTNKKLINKAKQTLQNEN